MQNLSVPQTYLTTTYKDKDAAKALGARWDGEQRQWYVPEGRDLAPFADWLPAGTALAQDSSPSSSQLTLSQPAGRDVASTAAKGISLSSLLAGISQAVAQAYRSGVWTLVEVVELRATGGHVFLGVSERDANGAVLAKTSAVIWQTTANLILPVFEQATGAQLAPGIKLLVRARPVFKPVHGFTLEIDAIDSEYTLGDLEARKREIRERLQVEGVFGANRQLSAPWDYNEVLVVAPEGAAGLGDFQGEADRLQAVGICRFTYVFSRFQGEGAATEIGNALQVAVARWSDKHATPADAIVIIRGGGAVNDLAWLNDYDLARFICDCPIPVLTGIGHERDNTVIDEVAHTRFDTPSKVIAGIEQLIAKRASQAKANFQDILNRASAVTQSVKGRNDALEAEVRALANRHLAQGRQGASESIHAIRVDAMQGIRLAAQSSSDAMQAVKSGVIDTLAEAKREVTLYWSQIIQSGSNATRSSKVAAETALTGVTDAANRHLNEGALRSEALMREITGQGPDKTLRRGFAMVRSLNGTTITGISQTREGVPLEIEFHDGKVAAIPSIQSKGRS
jgi:exodeoxyribonuclease VII large subunit